MNDLFYFDPLLFKYPKGVIKKSQTVTFCVKSSNFVETKPVSQVFLCIKMDGNSDYVEAKMFEYNDGWKIDVTFEPAGHFFYHFKIVMQDKVLWLCKTYDNYSCLLNYVGEDFFQLVTEEEYICKNSMQGGLIYQIFVDRFLKVGEVSAREPLIFREDWGGDINRFSSDPIRINQEVFGGNFKGVISKLDYLKNLGVTVIYFNPICMANSNHKYDTASYELVDPMFGSEEDFKTLIDEAKKRGIKIVIDGVYNHTGSDSIYFNKQNRFDSVGAYNSTSSKYYSWYKFEQYPDKYSSWWGIDTLPAIKENCKAFEEYIAGDNGIIEKFLKLGVFGVRLDVVDEIKDNFVKAISNKVREFGENNVVMGEVWEDAATKISYSTRRKYFADNELNSVMNYPIKESILNFMRSKEPTDLVSTIRMLQNNYPKVVLDNVMNFLGTHDTSRIFSELLQIASGDRELAKKLLKICFCLLFVMSGVPSIFYGDEYGMENNSGSSRGCFDWDNYHTDIYYFVEKLTKIRKLSCLKAGDENILYHGNGKFVLERKDENDRVIVGVNLRNSPLKFEIEGSFENFLTGKNQNSFSLNENEVVILVERKNK